MGVSRSHVAGNARNKAWQSMIVDHVMQHEIITTIEEWRALAPEWNALLADSNADSLFLTWQWLDTWLAVREHALQLLVVCVRDGDGRLAGAAPLYRCDYVLAHMLRYRMLRVLGDVESGAEYQTWIARRDCEAEAFAAIAAALRAARSEWDLLWMPKLPGWKPVSRALLDTLRQAGIRANRRVHTFSAIALPDDYEGYLGRMSASRRQQVRRTSNKILSRPGVSVRRVQTPAELASTLDALFRLHGKRWRAAGQQGVFDRRPLERAFYQRFAPLALEAGWLALYALCEHDDPKAVQLGYVYADTFLQLQEGFDPDYLPHVGNALRAHVIRDCIGRGVREYDFLGGISEHKRRWLAEARTGMDLLAGAARLRNAPVLRAGVWPTGAYLRPRTPAMRPAATAPTPCVDTRSG